MRNLTCGSLSKSSSSWPCSSSQSLYITIRVPCSFRESNYNTINQENSSQIFLPIPSLFLFVEREKKKEKKSVILFHIIKGKVYLLKKIIFAWIRRPLNYCCQVSFPIRQSSSWHLFPILSWFLIVNLIFKTKSDQYWKNFPTYVTLINDSQLI